MNKVTLLTRFGVKARPYVTTLNYDALHIDCRSGLP